jgi:hypothetical protein
MDWRYYWRRYFGWFPIQFCMTCGGWYWGGLPWIGLTWIPSWKEYCSKKCSDAELERVFGPPLSAACPSLVRTVEDFIRRVHEDGDAELEVLEIPVILDGIALAMENYRDLAADAGNQLRALNAAMHRAIEILGNAPKPSGLNYSADEVLGDIFRDTARLTAAVGEARGVLEAAESAPAESEREAWNRQLSAGGPIAYFCVQHGGSPACEEQNRKNGLQCPRCLAGGR